MSQIRILPGLAAGAAALLAAGCGMFQGKQAPPVVGGACEYADHPGTFEVVRRVPYLGAVTDVYFTYRPLDDAKPLDSDTTLHQRFNADVPDAGALLNGVRSEATSGTCTPLVYKIHYANHDLTPSFGASPPAH